jgi:hypothetical protein
LGDHLTSLGFEGVPLPSTAGRLPVGSQPVDENRYRKSISTKIELNENRFRRTSSLVGP